MNDFQVIDISLYMVLKQFIHTYIVYGYAHPFICDDFFNLPLNHKNNKWPYKDLGKWLYV